MDVWVYECKDVGVTEGSEQVSWAVRNDEPR